MAPIPEQDVVDKQVKMIIQDLYQIMVQVNTYDHFKTPTSDSADVLAQQIQVFDRNLLALNQYLQTPAAVEKLPPIPPELIEYIDNGRNPDIYTREFVEAARKSNQIMKGRKEAFRDFRDVLARQIVAAMPELEEDVMTVVSNTGGDPANLKVVA